MHGILLENHYDFVERQNHRQNLILDDELKKLANEEGRKIKALFLDSEIKNAYVMTPTMNAIFLMRHMSCLRFSCSSNSLTRSLSSKNFALCGSFHPCRIDPPIR